MTETDIRCPSCSCTHPLLKWKRKHEIGKLAEIACASCGFEPVGEYLTQFRAATAVSELSDDLSKRRKKKRRGLKFL